MAVPRAGDAVADCSSGVALGRLEVLSTGKRPAMAGDGIETPRLLATDLSSTGLERAPRIRLQFARARSLTRSWVVSLNWAFGTIDVASLGMMALSLSRIWSMPTLTAGEDLVYADLDCRAQGLVGLRLGCTVLGGVGERFEQGEWDGLAGGRSSWDVGAIARRDVR